MCTAISLQSGKMQYVLGRTMDFSYPIEPKLYVIPRNYRWANVLNESFFDNSYRFIAIGQQSGGMLGFFDGVNENGFAAAALYFPHYAKYDTMETAGKKPIASLDFLHFILGKCSSVAELEEILPHLSIVGLPDPVTQSSAPLHWIAADRNGSCAVIEPTAEGLKFHRNEIGVMANSPDFQWHMTNLRNYIGLSRTQVEETDWGGVPLQPVSQGAGAMLLPGGYTSPERFVRTAYLKTHIEMPAEEAGAIVTCFHIMESVTVPKGIVLTSRGTYDYTKYTAFMNMNTCEYFFNTYENTEIITESLWNYSGYSQPVCLGELARPVTFGKL